MSRIGLLLIVVSTFVGCGDQREAEKPVGPRIKKKAKVTSPERNQKFKMGEHIPFEIKAKDIAPDSVIVEMAGVSKVSKGLSFQVPYTSPRVGTVKPKVTVFFNGKSETHYLKVIFLPAKGPEEYTYEIVNTYPHDRKDYTQGLLISDGFLYESSGQYGKSTLEKKNVATGETLQQINLTDGFFGEGLALLENRFYQLTYTSGKCFVYNKNFEKVNTFGYQGQGWGLCEYQGNLLMSNGSEKILVRNPSTFSVIDEWEAYDHKGKMSDINELEIIDGLIYANVYQTDYIVAIDPESNAVIRKVDMGHLLKGSDTTEADVLNGIAHDKSSDKIFVTGKLWPKLFEVKFVPKKPVQRH